jgi:hypothetical protein
MDEIKNLIIEIFETKNENFKKGMIREFQKKEPLVAVPELYKYRELLIYEILKEISHTNDDVLANIDNPMNLIEETLFNHINSK